MSTNLTCEPVEEVLRLLAERTWIEKGKPSPGDEKRDWYEATDTLSQSWAQKRYQAGTKGKLIAWEKWARCVFKRPYLSLEAESSLIEISCTLSKQFRQLLPKDQRANTYMCVVLDGSPEYCQSRYEKHYGNGVKEYVEAVENKDGYFYKVCHASLEFYDAIFADGLTSTPSIRQFQDGLVACMSSAQSDSDSLTRAIKGAFNVKRLLTLCNEESKRLWDERFHPRISIGRELNIALRALRHAKRGETVVSLDSFPNDYCQIAIELLAASGVRLVNPPRH